MPLTLLTHLGSDATNIVPGKELFRSFDRPDRGCLILPCSITNVNEVDKYITHRHLTRFFERKNGTFQQATPSACSGIKQGNAPCFLL